MDILSKNYKNRELNLDVFIDFSNNRDIYLNATKTAKAFGKDISNWKRSPQTVEYIREIEQIFNSVNSTELELMVSKQGKYGGTWIHKSLIIMFARWLSPNFAVWCDLQIEEILKDNSTSTQTLTIQDQILGLESAIKILKVNEASKILMLSTLYKNIGLDTSYLPKYSDEQHTYSLSHLLKKFEVGISAKDMNLILLEKGILHTLERSSRNPTGVKTFKSLTEKGLKFGKNLISPHNQLQTQPHYFESSFEELLKLISEE